MISTAVSVSVIVPTHQRPDLLARLLQSLETQNLPKENFEVIVVPSPGDPGIAAAEAFAARSRMTLKCLLPQDDPWQGRNVSFKRNFGAQNAAASWLAFIDDDCMADSRWLENAVPFFSQPDIAGIEGKTVTPDDAPRTLTWRGMQRLSRFGGYQTCNIFYRKADFLEVGGFNRELFPWYLEDTDLAWSILDTGKRILNADSCLVVHPVGRPAPWRLMHEAKNAGLKVLLYRRHPEIYRRSGMRALRFYHYGYLLPTILIPAGLITANRPAAAAAVVGLIVVWLLHMIKTFRGLDFTLDELWGVAWRTLAAPPVAFLSVLKALVRNRCSPSEAVFLLRP